MLQFGLTPPPQHASLPFSGEGGGHQYAQGMTHGMDAMGGGGGGMPAGGSGMGMGAYPQPTRAPSSAYGGVGFGLSGAPMQVQPRAAVHPDMRGVPEGMSGFGMMSGSMQSGSGARMPAHAHGAALAAAVAAAQAAGAPPSPALYGQGDGSGQGQGGQGGGQWGAFGGSVACSHFRALALAFGCSFSPLPHSGLARECLFLATASSEVAVMKVDGRGCAR